jgi:hypothetical protein
MLNCPDSQDVGSEAAIIQRVRNSSLVEWFSADNLTGLKPATEAVAPPVREGLRGVGERSVLP